MKLPLEGGCLCGSVRYRITAAPLSADYCHCSMCRRAAGAPVVVRLTVANAALAWTAREPAVYRSSSEAERLRCPTCGTQLALRDEPDHLDVTLASLDDPWGGAPELSHLDYQPHCLVRHRGRPAALRGEPQLEPQLSPIPRRQTYEPADRRRLPVWHGPLPHWCRAD